MGPFINTATHLSQIYLPNSIHDMKSRGIILDASLEDIQVQTLASDKELCMLCKTIPFFLYSPGLKRRKVNAKRMTGNISSQV